VSGITKGLNKENWTPGPNLNPNLNIQRILTSTPCCPSYEPCLKHCSNMLRQKHELYGYLFISYFFKIALSHLHTFLGVSPYFTLHIPTYLSNILSPMKSFKEPLCHNIAPTSFLHYTLSIMCSLHHITQSSLWLCSLTLQHHLSPKGILQVRENHVVFVFLLCFSYFLTSKTLSSVLI
jgi:hypothetical protein